MDQKDIDHRMTSTECALIEQQIREQLNTLTLSPSHDHWHLDRVLSYARELQALHGGDPAVLTPAVLMHDLGRSDPRLHGQQSADQSVSLAERILRRVSLSPEEIEATLTAIREHDKPETVPSTVEGKILKDADFLAGFGAWGVVRIAMWAGEMAKAEPGFERGDVDRVLNRLTKRMPERLQGLEFEESRRAARRLVWFVDMFAASLHEPAYIDPPRLSGRYFVLEGISGSGKDTQALLLQQRLEELGYEVVSVAEPSDLYRQYRRLSELHSDPPDIDGQTIIDPVLDMFLLMADRYQLTQSTVLPALEAGKIVVGVRSFVSTLVYQDNLVFSTALMAYLHAHLPPPDLVLIYDLAPELAAERINRRAVQEGRPLSPREKKENLTTLRARYLDIAQKLPGIDIAILDADQTPPDLAEATWMQISRFLG